MLTEITKEWCGWLWVAMGGCGWFWVVLGRWFSPLHFCRHLYSTATDDDDGNDTKVEFKHSIIFTPDYAHTHGHSPTPANICCVHTHTHTHRHWGVLTAHAHRCSVAYLAINKFSILFFSPQKRKLKAVWGEGAFWIFYHNFLCFIFLWLSRDNWIAIEFNYF